MSYDKPYPRAWAPKDASGFTPTPISPTALDKIDKGIIDAHAELDGRLSEEELNTTFVAVRTADHQTLPAGTIVLLTLDKTLAQIVANPVADIADITFTTGA